MYKFLIIISFLACLLNMSESRSNPLDFIDEKQHQLEEFVTNWVQTTSEPEEFRTQIKSYVNEGLVKMTQFLLSSDAKLKERQRHMLASTEIPKNEELEAIVSDLIRPTGSILFVREYDHDYFKLLDENGDVPLLNDPFTIGFVEGWKYVWSHTRTDKYYEHKLKIKYNGSDSIMIQLCSGDISYDWLYYCAKIELHTQDIEAPQILSEQEILSRMSGQFTSERAPALIKSSRASR